MKLAATVILFNPTSSIVENLKNYLESVDKLYIIDNSPISQLDSNIIENDKVELIHDGENKGIPLRLNHVIKKCITENYTHLLTMDQDSFFYTNQINEYQKRIKSFSSKKIGMYGVSYDTKKKLEKIECNKTLITSGSILDIQLANKIGMFDENLFIDGVDTEYCLKLFKNGYNTLMFNDIQLNHRLGEPILKLTPHLKHQYRSLHDSNRIYYMVRNNFYLRNKYKDKIYFLPWKPILNEIKNALFYGDEKTKTIFAVVKGYKHFKHKKMGKI